MPRNLHDPLDFALALGYQIELDYDGEVLIRAPESIDVDDVTTLLREIGKDLFSTLAWRAKKARRQFVGGPLSGHPHDKGVWNSEVVVRIGRAKWVAYEVTDMCDGRAYYRGAATSEKKARQLIRQLRRANQRERGDAC